MLVIACSNKHVVNVTEIEANKNKVFEIGIVKVEGQPYPFVDDVDKKKTALTQIPIEEICKTLSSAYGLQINPNVNREIRIAREKPSGQNAPAPDPGRFGITLASMSDNPYFGNKRYEEGGLMSKLFAVPAKLQDEDVGEMVYLTYGFKPAAFSPKYEFYYKLVVKSNAEILIKHEGTVAVVPVPFGLPFGIKSAAWKELISNAGRINEALKKDINNRM
jgi:hypothetical protein